MIKKKNKIFLCISLDLHYLCTQKYKLDKMKDLKRWLPDVLAVVLFAVLAFAYFFPADTEHRILYQHDTSAGAGAGQEIKEYKEQTGELSRWTNSLFGGMPTYVISPSYDSYEPVKAVENAYHLWLPDYVWHLFASMLGFFILLRAFNFKTYLATLGSILWAFSTYFLIIIAAGHMWKVMALAYLPPMIAGIVLAYRGKYLWGLLVTAIFTALELHANHVQMTYYYGFIILFMIIAYLIEAVREKKLKGWLTATGVCIVGGLLGVLVNFSNLYHTWEYSKATMRGGSELKTDAQADNATDGGLERSYITQYSYGKGETWSLLIPNVKGGASMRADAEQGTAFCSLSESSAAKAKANETISLPDGRSIAASDVLQGLPQYWDEGGTMGPVYVGALVILLFVLSLFVVRGPMKWALLAVTVISILLAWGRNYQAFTDFFIDHVPMYAKFRTVESILVIAEFTIPLMAMMGLKRIIDEPELLRKRINVTTLIACISAFFILMSISSGIGIELFMGLLALLIVMVNSTMNYFGKKSPLAVFDKKELPLTPLTTSFALVGGALLLFALVPSFFFNFSKPDDPEWVTQISGIKSLVTDVRVSIFTADCWRSLAIVAIGAVVLWLYMTKKLKALPAIAIIAVVCLFDLWQVNKNYLNDGMFRSDSIKEETHAKTPLDDYLLQDKTQDYRVLNMPYDERQLTTVFNENQTSYYHKSVGGYHAAKMQRYQDIIDSCIIREMLTVNYYAPQLNYQLDSIDTDLMMPVLNMLNTRYVVVKTPQGLMPMLNSNTCGNAWFVDKVSYVGSAKEELEALNKTNLRHEAVADKQFEKVLGQAAEQDSTSVVTLESYKPNHLVYDVESNNGGVLVFSEIYYPSWTATVDGKPVELGRVNYVLRALHIDGGKHKVELDFHPASIAKTETVAYIAMALIVLLLAGIIFMEWRKNKKSHKNE